MNFAQITCCIVRELSSGLYPFQMRFQDVENLENNKNMIRAQIKEITRCAQTKFFNLLITSLLFKVF